MPIRPSNTVNIIKRRLNQAEIGEPDGLELIGLYDELARLERKWLMQLDEGSERRRPTDIDKLDGWFGRLQHQIERGLRGQFDDPTVKLLRTTLSRIKARKSSGRELR